MFEFWFGMEEYISLASQGKVWYFHVVIDSSRAINVTVQSGFHCVTAWHFGSDKDAHGRNVSTGVSATKKGQPEKYFNP